MVTPDDVAAAVIARWEGAAAPFGAMPVRYGRKGPQQGEPPYLVLLVTEQPAAVWESDQKLVPFRLDLTLYATDPDHPKLARRQMAARLDGTPAAPAAGLVVTNGVVTWSRPMPGRLAIDDALMRGGDLYAAGGSWDVLVTCFSGG